MAIFEMLAQSLAPTACTTIEEVGSTGVGALTVAFLVLAITAIIFIARSSVPGPERPHIYICLYICGVAALGYFAMLSGQGWTAIAGCRQFFYARYFDWAVTNSLIVLNLGLIAGADSASIAATIGAEVVVVFATYMGSVAVVTTVKWFWFTFSLVALVFVLYSIARTFKDSAILRGGAIASLYGQLAALILICWIFYPLIWVFSSGFASFSVSFEVCAYAVIDICAKVIFSFIILSGREVFPPGNLVKEYV
eukprot:CAMPEP_0113679484 /NCGR_PEP_ID=MMETSP0038_2-20120614/10672_1 /TAXON_ID=2898 /ORGANISM="Cryptomonas paramecium" /LENGTH=251 /DNA_ID=CAMNT_0000597525 /DNA_START=17 /DNA_END=772 /DNA_ORIENTATION=- /assembly_acc=CAM_ASM_000170